jgi:hypothetical protein
MRRWVAALLPIVVASSSVLSCKGRRQDAEIGPLPPTSSSRSGSSGSGPSAKGWEASGPIPATTFASYEGVSPDDGKFPLWLRPLRLDPITPRPPVGRMNALLKPPDLLVSTMVVRSPAGVRTQIANASDFSCSAMLLDPDGDATTRLGRAIECIFDPTKRFLALSQGAKDADGKVLRTNSIVDVETLAEALLPQSTCSGSPQWSGERLIEHPAGSRPKEGTATPVCVFDRAGRLLARIDARIGWAEGIEALWFLHAALGFLPADPDVFYALELGDTTRACQLHLLDLRRPSRRKTWTVGPAPNGCDRYFYFEASGTLALPELRYSNDHGDSKKWTTVRAPDVLPALAASAAAP